MLGGPWDLVITYNWDYNPTCNWGTPISPLRRITSRYKSNYKWLLNFIGLQVPPVPDANGSWMSVSVGNAGVRFAGLA